MFIFKKCCCDMYISLSLISQACSPPQRSLEKHLWMRGTPGDHHGLHWEGTWWQNDWIVLQNSFVGSTKCETMITKIPHSYKEITWPRVKPAPARDPPARRTCFFSLLSITKKKK